MRRERKEKLSHAELRAAGVSRNVVVRKVRRALAENRQLPGPNEPRGHERGDAASAHNTSESPPRSEGGRDH